MGPCRANIVVGVILPQLDNNDWLLNHYCFDVVVNNYVKAMCPLNVENSDSFIPFCQLNCFLPTLLWKQIKSTATIDGHIIVALINLHCCKAIPQCGEKGIEGRKETFCATFEFGVIMIVVIVFVGVIGLDEIVGLLASVLCCWVITLHCRTDVEILECVWTSRWGVGVMLIVWKGLT